MSEVTLIPKAEVARKHGLSGFTNAQITSSFRTGEAPNVLRLEFRVESLVRMLTLCTG